MRHIAFLVVLSASTLMQPAWALQDRPCQNEEQRTVDALIERWAWESFWDGSTSGFRYQPRAKASVEVFWNTGLIGMCSLELGACTAYERNVAGLGHLALADRLRGTGLHQATEVFLRRLNEPRVITGSSDGGSRGHWERGGTVVSIPTPASDTVIQRNVSGLQTCVVANRSFPPLGTPQPIRDKITPESLGAFQDWLEGRLHPPAGSKSEYVIPYYASNDPMIYVLVRVNGAVESVIFAVADPSGKGWRLGGHFDSKESPAQVHRLELLILSAENVILHAKRN